MKKFLEQKIIEMRTCTYYHKRLHILNISLRNAKSFVIFFQGAKNITIIYKTQRLTYVHKTTNHAAKLVPLHKLNVLTI